MLVVKEEEEEEEEIIHRIQQAPSTMSGQFTLHNCGTFLPSQSVS